MQKVVQRGLLDFLQTRVGLILLICGAFYCLNTIIGLLHILITTSTSPICPHCARNDYSDTIGTGADSRHTIVYPSGALDGSQTSFESTLCYEPIDIVYTWVNGSDPKLIADLAYWKALSGEGDEELAASAAALALNSTLHNSTLAKQDMGDQTTNNRFRDNQELRYSLRSIWKFAPWVRHVFIVTNGHVPYWLNLNHPRVTLVSHADIFPNRSHLPTFSSPAIESHLHRIPGIASKFIYFNDDVMLGNKITPDDFVTHGGGQKIFLSWNVPNCAPGCPDTWLADKYCDTACNNADCNWDMGDCLNTTRPDGTRGGAGGDARYNNWESSRGGSGGGASNARYCASGCPNNWVGDKVCDRACKNAECAFDGGDCGLELIKTHLPGVELPVPGSAPIISEFVVPFGTASLYVNLSTAFPGATAIVEANHDNPALVRSAIVTQNLKVLTLILFDEGDITPDGQHGDIAQLDDLALNATSTTPDAPEASEENAANRRVEIYIQGELNGVFTNLTFDIVRPRVPTAAQLAAQAAEAAAEAAAASQPIDRRIVEDPEAMFAAHAAAQGQIHDSTTEGDAAPNVNAQMDQAEVVAGDAVAAAETTSEGAPVTRPGRRLLSLFDTMVSSLRSLGRGTSPAKSPKSSKTSSPTQTHVPDAPYQPEAGYGHTRAYVSSPASATKQKATASYRAATFQPQRPDGIYHHWQDMPVYIDSVPISDDIAHSGVKLREGLDETTSTQPGENLWRRHDDHHVPVHSETLAPNALHDADGRVIEAYGWSARDHELAAHIVQHKKKQLWLMERDIARQNFMDAWRASQVEKRRLLEGRWEQVWAEESAHSHAHGSGQEAIRQPRFNRDPVWPWEIKVAAPDLFEEWDWAAEAARFGKNSEVIAKLTHHRPKNAHNDRQNGFEFELDPEEEGERIGASDEVEATVSLFGDLGGEMGGSDPASSTGVSMGGMDMANFGSNINPLSASSQPAQPSEDDHDHSAHADVTLPAGAGPRRTLLDLYGDSLRFVNNLYTIEFGKETRKAPAHMPHMIDVGIESELQARWPQLFDETSSHRFRHSHDMQYSFSYFYYLMNVPRSFSLPEVWQEQLDLNGDGLLDPIEIRYMTLWLSGKKILPRDLVKMHEKLINTTKLVYGYEHSFYNLDDPPRIDIEVLSRSGDILDLIEDKWSSLRKYKFELVDLDQIEFYMVPDDTTKVQLRLDEIRAKMPKFVCLNDDMNKTADPPAATLQALKDFYISYFPNPCPFENPEDQPNNFMYIDEWRQQQQSSFFGLQTLKTRFNQWFSSPDAASSASTSSPSSSPTPSLTYVYLYFFASLITFIALLLLICTHYQLWPKCKRFMRSKKAHQRTA